VDTFYRVGGKQPRNIYRVTPQHPEGEYIGVFFDEADAAVAVAALNTVHGMLIPGVLELP
jgi:hypothetical protein